jgi:dihydroorotate dehydrogenase (fumarate)
MNIETSYLGLRLAHPFMAGASPMGYVLDHVKRLEDGGCAAVVLHSLFEEQITYEREGRIAGVSVGERAFEDIYAHFPPPSSYPLGPDEYAEHIRRLKQAVSIPVIGSLNGRTKSRWLEVATNIEQAGADALELNLYQVVTDLSLPATHIEAQLIGTVEEVRALVKIPIAVKLSPFFTAMGNVAHRVDQAGADGVVLFNRFYQPDINIHTRRVSTHAELSTSAELLLRLRWAAILHGRINASIAVSGGVAVPADGIKALLAGADAVQVVSALLRNGPAYIAAMRRGLEDWLEQQQLASLAAVQGSLSLKASRDPSAYERAHYIRVLQSSPH